MATAWFGIVFAAGLFPLAVFGITFVCVLFSEGLRFQLDVFGDVIPGTLLLFVIGIFYGIVMTIPAYVLLKLFDWVSGGVISERGASGVYGGLVGFLCTTGGGLFFASHQGGQFNRSAVYFGVLVPLLAIVMGYVGAVWAGYRSRHVDFPYFEPLVVFEQQFSIAYLMKLTVFVAVLAVICKAVGSAGFVIGLYWVFCCVVQSCLLLCDYWIQQWVGKREMASGE